MRKFHKTYQTNKLTRSYRLGLMSFLISSSVFGGTHASVASCPQAQREFFVLKKHGVYLNYIENKTYVEVEGSSFIGLQRASNETRTCLYGIFQPVVDQQAVGLSTETYFVCFNSADYNLIERMEWDEAEVQKSDPTSISIGIGNIKVFNPEISGQGFGTKHLLDSFPKTIEIDVYRPDSEIKDFSTPARSW